MRNFLSVICVGGGKGALSLIKLHKCDNDFRLYDGEKPKNNLFIFFSFMYFCKGLPSHCAVFLVK